VILELDALTQSDKVFFTQALLLWIHHLRMTEARREHFKHIIIDGKFAYSGSANLTGAGLGIKSANTRNFESGFITSDLKIVEAIMTQFDEVWLGKFCKDCKRKNFCQDPII
jgi:phosphatidylserine/phosphatidylglycerophosphate/cardiolipin synthase-like enzyme